MTHTFAIPPLTPIELDTLRDLIDDALDTDTDMFGGEDASWLEVMRSLQQKLAG